MTKKYKILGKFISDMSSETKDIETYIFVKDRNVWDISSHNDAIPSGHPA